jgi:serine protease Do
MINQPSQFPQAPRRSPFSARRIALMASVVAGLGVAGYGLDRASDGVFGGAAHAQVSSDIGKAAQPAGFADIVQRVKPSVMSVKVTMKEKADDVRDDGEGHHGLMAQGSGFFISPDGYAVTNNHVVEDATKVEVTTDDGKVYQAKVIGTDKRTDLALIKVEGGSDFPFAKLADGKARIGDWVLAVGNPFGLGGTVTAGIVSANGRDIGSGPYDNYIQIDAPVNKGNSGGPSFNMQGEVVGVNTAIYSPSGGSVGIAFSVPAATVKTVVAQLKATGSVSRGWLGVQIQPVTQDIADSLGLKKAEGALVADSQTSSPAAKAGIQSGDVITAVNGDTVKDAHELSRTIGGLAPGDSIKLSLLRNGKDDAVTLTLGKMPNVEQASAETETDTRGDVPRLGLTIAPASSVEGAGRNGVVVTGVDPDGAAAERGFKEGDVILEVAGKPVASPGDVSAAVRDARAEKRSSVLMRVRSSDGSHYVAVPFAAG